MAAPLPGRWGEEGAEPQSVGTLSHRPFPELPGEAGMARGTRALSGGALVKGLAFWRPRWKVATA